MNGRMLLAEYGTYHRDSRNLICHEIGIPLIVLSIFAWLELVRFSSLNLAMIFAVLVLAYYMTIDRRLALIAIPAFLVFYYVGSFITWPVALAIFIIGWIFQLVGHRFEGNSPAFLKNLMQLLIGPLFVIGKLTGTSVTAMPSSR